jgi:hypothetical protein
VAATPDGTLRVVHQRFGHYDAEARLEVEVHSSGKEPAELWISSDYLRSVEVRGITPPPSATRLEGDGVVYRFDGAGPGPKVALFDILHTRLGRVTGRVRQGGGPVLEFHHWIYP